MLEKDIANWVRSLWRAGKSFYKTYEWKIFREKVLRKRKYRCEICWQGGLQKNHLRRYKRATTLHHIKHLKDAPELALEEENMIAVCKDCHKALHPEIYERSTALRERWD